MEALQRLHNRGSISTGYNIDNSCKFEHDNAESLYKNQVQGTQTTWTFSTWLKRTQLSDSTDSYMHVWAAGSSSSDNGTKFYFRGDSSYPENRIFFYLDNGGSQYLHGTTSQSFRDTSAWLHIVWAVDTTQSTASDRSKVYINGELQTLVGVSGAAFTNPPQNSSTRVNDNGGVMYVGAQNVNGGNRFNGYLAETVLIDGSQLAVTDFGEFDEDSGIWKPKDVSGLTFGTRGFYLDYSDASNLGNDADGSTEFTESNITSADQATDSPTNNFAILSQSMQGYYEDLWSVISEGGTKFRCTEFDAFITSVSSIGVTKGKWYAEFKYTGARPNNFAGIASMEQLDNNSGYIYGGYLGEDGESWGIGYYQSNGKLYVRNNAGSSTTASWGAAVSQNQTVGVALDMDNHKLYFSVNGTYQNSGDPTSGATGTGAISIDDTETVAIATSGYSLGSGNDTINEANFGGFSATSTGFTNTDGNGYGTFAYAPPSGYYALCTKNLEEFG